MSPFASRDHRTCTNLRATTRAPSYLCSATTSCCTALPDATMYDALHSGKFLVFRRPTECFCNNKLAVVAKKRGKKKKNWQRQQCRVTNRGFESCANDFYFVFFSLFLFFLFFSPILAIEPATSLFISPTSWNSRTFAYSAKKNSLGDGMKEKYIVETDLLPELISRD